MTMAQQKGSRFMQFFKKTAAFLAALSTISALGVGAVTASAADIEDINNDIIADQANSEELFVASFDNYEDASVANYLIDNGVPLADDDDVTWLTRYITDKTDLEFTFSDGLTHYTKATAELVADFDKNGSINTVDVIKLNQYISSN